MRSVLGCAATLAFLGAFESPRAQGPANPPRITFDAIADAESGRYEIGQVRRVLEPTHDPNTKYRWVSIRESLRVAPDDPLGHARFSLQFDGLVGTQFTPAQIERRRQLYEGYAGYLYLYASFRIDDPDAAARNYSILFIETRQRLGRPVHRVALLPKQLGRNPWVLDLDAETGYPLFRGEYSAAGILVSSLEVTSFLSDPISQQEVPISWWQPRMPVADFSTLQAALQQMPQAPFTFPDPGDLPSGYAFHKARIVRSDLNTEVSLVVIYSDGIDEIFHLQTLNAPALAVPAAPQGSTETPYAILTYQDLNVAQFMFQRNGVQHMVVGRTLQSRLRDLAATLLHRALTGR